MNTNPLFDTLVDGAYERIYRRGESTDSAIAALIEAGNNRPAAEMVVQLALERRKEEQRVQSLNFPAWIRETATNVDITSSGWGYGALALVSMAGAAFVLYWVEQWLDFGDWREEAYRGVAIVAGVIIFAAGTLPFYCFLRRRRRRKAQEGTEVQVSDVVASPGKDPLEVPGIKTYDPRTDYEGDWDWLFRL